MTCFSPPEEVAAASTSATALAEKAIDGLSTRFPGKVQIHLHPSTSLPSTLVSTDFSSSSSAVASTQQQEEEGLPVALVWTVDSLRLLRSYGLTGSFTGTLAQFPQQNVFLGLPIQLLPEEVVFLLRRGCAVVVDEVASYREGTVEERRRVEQGVERERKSQQLEAWYERQALRAKHSHAISAAASSSSRSQAEPEETELQGLPWHYTIPTTSSQLPWYQPRTSTTLSSVQPSYAFPRTRAHVESVALFEHFATRGMWCMNGLRFGGALAVYPGDPLRYHSHYTAQLVSNADHLSLMSLVANGRLGTAVKKTHLLCCVERVDEALECELRRIEEKEEGERVGERGEGLQCIAKGTFDVAVRGDKDPTRAVGGTDENNNDDDDEAAPPPSTLATFTVFSLAWAGFGT